MKKKVIEVKNLKLRLDGHSILEDITFDVFDREIVFIIGPNGAGKTTLIKIILGLINQDSGTISLFGNKNTVDVISRYCSYVPQYSEIDRSFPIAVDEIVNLNTDPPNLRKKIKKSLSLVGGESLYNKSLGQLSGGEFQKVLIARSLANNPKILILDEPTNNLDVSTQQYLFELLKRFRDKQGITSVVVSHDINVVANVADRVICMNRQLGCTGKPSDILTKDIIESVYGRSLGFYKHT